MASVSQLAPKYEQYDDDELIPGISGIKVTRGQYKVQVLKAKAKRLRLRFKPPPPGSKVAPYFGGITNPNGCVNLPSTMDREQDLEYWLEPAGCDQAPILRFWDDLVEEVTGEIRTTAILPRDMKRLKWAWMSYQPAGAPDYVEGKGWLIGTGQCPFGTCMDRDPIPEYGDSQMFARHLVEFHGFAKRWYSCRRKSNSSRDCVVNGTPFGTSRKGCMVRHQKDVHHRSLEEILRTLDLIDYYSPAFNLTESQHMKRFPGYISVENTGRSRIRRGVSRCSKDSLQFEPVFKHGTGRGSPNGFKLPSHVDTYWRQYTYYGRASRASFATFYGLQYS